MLVFWDMALIQWDPTILRQSSGVWILLGHYDIWRSGHHVTSKHWYPITQWHNAISQKNGVCRIYYAN